MTEKKEQKPIIVPKPELPPTPSEIVIAKSFHVGEPSQGPRALRARFTCDSCLGMSYVEIPWDATPLDRSTLMKAAVDEHRFICPVGLPEDARIYRIHYPR